MDVPSLPRYRGLPDSPPGWGEEDGHGKRPRLRLRDYVVLSLISMICIHITPCLVVHFSDCHRNAEIMNSARERQLEAEMRRSLF